MAGPLSSSEIEDVVSSVRRLVSVDARPRPASHDLAQDKLILTPSLRVVTEQVAPDPLLLTVPIEEPTADAAPFVEAEWEDEIWQEEPLPLAEIALGVEEAEVVDLEARGGAAAEAALGAPPTETEAPLADWVDSPEDVSATATVVPLVQPDAAAVEPVADLASTMVEAPAAEPGPVTTEPVAPQPVSEAASRTQSAADPVEEPGLGDVQTLVDKDGNPLTVLDEDALHEIVRSLIREELQGVLGERITRNVRKLVRAEINRALTARALD